MAIWGFVILCVLLAGFGNGFYLGFFILAAALVSNAQLIHELELHHYLLIGGMVLSLPLTGLLTGVFLDSYLSSKHLRVIEAFIFSLVSYLFLQSNQFFRFYEVAVRQSLLESYSQEFFSFFLLLGTTVISVSVVIAMFYIVLLSTIEFVFGLLYRNSEQEVAFRFAPIRQLLLLFLMSVSSNVVVGFLSTRLSPASFSSWVF